MSKQVYVVLPLLRYAHVFRRDRLNHVVVTDAPRVRRNGRSHTLCAQRVDDTFQRRISTGSIAAPVDCPRCLPSMTAIMDLIEQRT